MILFHSRVLFIFWQVRGFAEYAKWGTGRKGENKMSKRSRREVSSIVQGAGLLTSIFSVLYEKVREKGGGEKDIHRLASPEGAKTVERLAEIIVEDSSLKKEDFGK